MVATILAAFVLASGGHGRVGEGSYRSRALRGTLPFAVCLPPGYSTSHARYPVIYFLHGLPASPYAFRGIGFVAAALDALGRPAIVIAPRGARDGDSDPEYLDWGSGRNWETAIATELPRYVDAHYRTIPGRRGRALVGLSAGGYGAVLLAIHHLDDFSVIESWSGYFRPTNPAGTAVIPHSPAQSAHALVPQLRADESRRPTFFAFYVGAGRQAVPRGERAARPRAERSGRAARLPDLSRSARPVGLAGTHPCMAIACARPPPATGRAMTGRVAVTVAGLALVGGLHGTRAIPPGFRRIANGPDGGTVVQGWIPNPAVPRFFRATVVYLPPGYDPARRYPVVYLLQGFPGSPYQYVDGIELPSYADPRIAAGSLRPFIAVVPPAGIDAYHGDWTGVWEQYLVHDVVPWTDANLPTIAARRGRVLAGLSAGGFGAVDIGLRHPQLSSTLEAWIPSAARGRAPARPPGGAEGT
ncbi:MAG TPA: alpha/beta hydrolase-fold protein [Gaiellaceae bacterium]